jgi:putative ABC transport system permease protein
VSGLFRFFSLRHLRSRAFRALLGLAAVALGVSLYISSQVMTGSARASLQQTAQRLAGRAQWQVTRGRSLGVEEALVGPIRRLPGVVAAPLVQASVVLREPRGGTLLVLGIDFMSDSVLRLYRFAGDQAAADPTAFAATALTPGGILVTRRFAARHQLAVGSPVVVNTRQGLQLLTITGLLADEGPAQVYGGDFAVMELHAAQALFGRPGFVSRIEVAGATREQLRLLCPGCDVGPTARAGGMAEEALARLESLVVVSLIALLVGLLLIYNSVQVSVVERLKEIGTLRALGATRRQLLVTILLEWLAVGLAGSLLGVGLGYLLGRALLGYTARAINALVPLIDFQQVTLTPAAAATGAALGVGTAVAAAFFPALGATRVPPVELLRPHGYRLIHRHRLAFWLGLAVAVVGGGMMGVIPVSPAVGLAGTALVFLGLALLLPQVLMAVARWARPLLAGFRVEAYLAADNLVKAPQRTALTAVTLGGALAMLVATAALVGGLQTATNRWIREALPFDLAISGSDFSASLYREPTIPGALLPAARRIDGVELAYGLRTAFAGYRGRDVLLVGVEIEPFLEMHRRRGMSAWARTLSRPGLAARLRAGEGVCVSDNFAALFGVRPGDSLALPTPAGLRRLPVLATFEDYSWPRGTVLLDLSFLRRLWGDDALSYIDLAVAPGVDRQAVRARVASQLAGQATLFLYDPDQIRRISEDLLRQSLVVANAQVLVAILIGFLGIVNSLLIGVLQRTRELGLLRAAGMTARQVARTVLFEGIFMALTGGVIGVVAGLLGGWLPLRLFTFAVTGHLVPRVVPWPHLAIALAGALALGFLASILPARHAARLPVLEAVGYE